MFTETR